jgi:hypothetical protein
MRADVSDDRLPPAGPRWSRATAEGLRHAFEAGSKRVTVARGARLNRMNDPYIQLLLTGGFVVLPSVIAVWAHLWHRRPLVWALITMLATPYLFLVVVIALALKGRSRLTPG